jgi:hypothetical protein
MRYAVVSSDDVIVNLIEWDPASSPWQPPEGMTAHAFADGPVSLGWHWNGGAPIDPTPPPPPPPFVPMQVNATQLISALDQRGLLGAVDAAMAKADPLTQRLWARAAVFARNDPLVLSFAQDPLNMTPAEIDTLFQLAATL